MKIEQWVRAVPDFPIPGVLFRDLTPLLARGDVFEETVRRLAEPYAGAVDVVAGIEARGFLFAAPVALALGVGFVPIRKPGKLPGAHLREEYALEYGTACLELHRDALEPGQRVLLIDDVLATGGTADAASSLVRRLGAAVVAAAFVIEISALGGRARLLPDLEVASLIRY